MTPKQAAENGGHGETGHPYGSLRDLQAFVTSNELGLRMLERTIYPQKIRLKPSR